MQEFWPVLQQTPLFAGITEDKADRMLACLSAARRTFAKGAYVLRTGDDVNRFGMLLSGSVQVVAEDFWGNLNILAILGVGEVFAESYACLPGAKLTVDVIALEDTEALFLDARNALMPCSSACDEHGALVRNLAAMLAAKNLNLNDKLHHVTQRSTREKLLSYLSAQSARAGSPSFSIPFNRQQLADYLAVERSAMSAELGRLRDEGVLTFQKNSFRLR
jgi:CRP/FNR family transcriptional regulator, dissimilatory nitrate respiration regulator